MPRGNPDDRPDCLVCGDALPSRHDRASQRGRPRRYCSNLCKERARCLAALEKRAASCDENGQPERAAAARARLALNRQRWGVPE